MFNLHETSETTAFCTQTQGELFCILFIAQSNVFTDSVIQCLPCDQNVHPSGPVAQLVISQNNANTLTCWLVAPGIEKWKFE